ncbi:PorP/SprF family type IX secretion system membrane protein [Capnocytophaga leadbetteri]|uniref:PorP/SprF family type IX secretion system membrane protein n=1 Tax=Capnocytophaga leadbetteri TaxID=327575 RepID=UPI0028E5100A|nr:PorP/SprF family type IX secretion system membrane protein [Capnocytophaga leadbetteri]
MKIISKITVLVFVLCTQYLLGQSDGNYLPYELPGHTAVKYNTYLMNPAFPIFGKNESQITFFHRNQWMGFKEDKFNTFGLSYGKKWGGDAGKKTVVDDGNNMAHGLIFQRTASIFANTGVLGNYVHQVEISDDNFLRLGINAVFARSSIDKSKVRVNVNDPLIENAKAVNIINIQPGFDINFNEMHFGITAENLLDYAFSAGEMAVPFNEKSLTAHAMYRHALDSNSDFLEDAVLTILAKGKKSSDNFQLGGHVMLDAKMGWAYAGYDQKYGAFGGLGFNIANHLSIGFGYEQSIAAYVSELGGSYDIVLSYQFGGKHHIKPPKVTPTPPAPPAPPVVEKPKPAVATPTVKETKTPTTPPPAPKGPKSISDQLKDRMTLVEDKIAGAGIPEGHYVVIGVYRNAGGAYDMLKKVRQLGLSVFSFKHPENQMTYLYVEKPFASRGEAGEAMINLLRRPEFKNSRVWVLKVGR